MDAENQVGTQEPFQDRQGIRRIVLRRSIVLGGTDAEEGSIHDVSRAKAIELIAEGAASLHESEAPDPVATSVTRMETPTNRDPKPRQVAPAPPKVKKGGGK